jgi:cobalt-zinc-cadmium efflux system protein
LVTVAGLQLLRDSARVLLESTPSHLDPKQISSAIAQDPDVSAVHHMHVWSIDSENPALSAHVVIEGESSLHDAQQTSDRLKAMLARRFGVEHATLEVECHDCEVDTPHASSHRQ